jgi:hypothetical protein
MMGGCIVGGGVMCLLENGARLFGRPSGCGCDEKIQDTF